jgi:hypothetical protein
MAANPFAPQTVKLVQDDPQAVLAANQRLLLQQQLAAQLQQEAAQPIQADPRAPISKYQGLAKLLSGAVGLYAQNKANATQREMAAAQQAQFDKLLPGERQIPAPRAAPADGTVGFDAGQAASAGPMSARAMSAPGTAGLSPTTSALADALAPRSAPAAPPPSSPSPSAGGALPSLTGDAAADRALGLQIGVPEYAKLVAAQYSPTDFQKLMRAASIDPNSTIGRMLLQQQLAKQNFISPTVVGEGGTALDPSGRPIFQAPKTPVGSTVQYGPDGKPTGVAVIPGAPEAAASAAESTQLGQTLGGIVNVPQAGGGPPMPALGRDYLGGRAPGNAPSAVPATPAAGPAAPASAPRAAGERGAAGPAPAAPQSAPDYWQGITKFAPPSGPGSLGKYTEGQIESVNKADDSNRTKLNESAVAAMNRVRQTELMLPHLKNSTTGAGADALQAVRSVIAHSGMLPQSELDKLTDTQIADKYLSRNGTEGLLAKYGRVTQGEVNLAVQKQAPNLTQTQQAILKLSIADAVDSAYQQRMAADYTQYRARGGDPRDFERWYSSTHSIDEFAKAHTGEIASRLTSLYNGPQQSASPAVKAPAVGAVMGGYRFKGGNPADKANWEPVQ